MHAENLTRKKAIEIVTQIPTQKEDPMASNTPLQRVRSTGLLVALASVLSLATFPRAAADDLVDSIDGV